MKSKHKICYIVTIFVMIDIEAYSVFQFYKEIWKTCAVHLQKSREVLGGSYINLCKGFSALTHSHQKLANSQDSGKVEGSVHLVKPMQPVL